MRRGEVCGLKWEAVDLDQGLVEVRNTRLEVDGRIFDKPYPKSKHGRRIIPIDRAVVAVLASERTRQKKERLRLGEAWQQSEYVVVRSDGTGVSPNQFTKTFKRLQGDLPDVRLHDLRHTWGTLAIANGVDPKTVSQLLGHASVNFTLDVYVGQVDEKRREAAQRMSDVLGLG
jgi:integrase